MWCRFYIWEVDNLAVKFIIQWLSVHRCWKWEWHSLSNIEMFCAKPTSKYNHPFWKLFTPISRDDLKIILPYGTENGFEWIWLLYLQYRFCSRFQCHQNVVFPRSISNYAIDSIYSEWRRKNNTRTHAQPGQRLESSKQLNTKTKKKQVMPQFLGRKNEFSTVRFLADRIPNEFCWRIHADWQRLE